MAIDKKQVVTINYVLKDDEGTVLEDTGNSNPLSFISGNSQILPKLEEEITGMNVGDKKTVVLPPEQAYGTHDPNAERKVIKTDFPEGTQLEEGMSFMADMQNGQRVPFRIKDIEGEQVTIDFNHPLAGQTLEFNLELLGIRDATAEEIEHGHVHGPGGHQH